VVTDSKGQRRYVFLLASKWEQRDLKAYLELLSIIVAGRFGGSATTIWCMDLRAGKDFKWSSSSRIRTKCERAANLYARFLDVMSKP
jgi:hypothetical protein